MNYITVTLTEDQLRYVYGELQYSQWHTEIQQKKTIGYGNKILGEEIAFNKRLQTKIKQALAQAKS